MCIQFLVVAHLVGVHATEHECVAAIAVLAQATRALTGDRVREFAFADTQR